MIGSNLFKSDPSQDPSGKRDSDPRPPPWQGGALPLSYFRNTCQKNLSSGKRDSDPRPPPWQGGALPLSYFRNACQKNLSSGKRDSNPRPRPWEGRALPTELFPPLRTAVAHGAYRTANIACLIFSTKFFFASPPCTPLFPLFCIGKYPSRNVSPHRQAQAGEKVHRFRTSGSSPRPAPGDKSPYQINSSNNDGLSLTY